MGPTETRLAGQPSQSVHSSGFPAVPDRPRFLSEADCRDIAERLARYAQGGGETGVHIVSRWIGNARWGRNQLTVTGEDRNNQLHVFRGRHNVNLRAMVVINDTSDAALAAATRRAEQILRVRPRADDADPNLVTQPGFPLHYSGEPVDTPLPALFRETTYQLDAGQRAAAANTPLAAVTAAGMLAAGYLEVSATSFAYITSWGYTQYFQYTWAQYSTTVRDPKGTGSGWAGAEGADWRLIDSHQLSARALEKCLQSRNPVAVEPGRYTTILEPQAVRDFVSHWSDDLYRWNVEAGEGPLHASGKELPPFTDHYQEKLRNLGRARFGERVIDERLTLSADPADPELGFPPFSKDYQGQPYWQEVYHRAVWIENGVLKALPYFRPWAIKTLGRSTGLPSSGALRIGVSGATTSLEEMIVTTRRGLLVTRLWDLRVLDPSMAVYTGATRDGLWLIENGKITKAAANLQFTESIWFALNNVEQAGEPQHTFDAEGQAWWRSAWVQNPQPVIAPALKVRDFNFTALRAGI